MVAKTVLWMTAAAVLAGYAAGQPQASELPEGEGKAILQTVCTVCHSLKEVTKFSGFYSRENWRDIIGTMISDGANLKDAQVPVLVDYLTRTFPKQFPDGDGKKLLDRACTGCHAAADVRRFDGYYAKKDWNDLVKVMVANGAQLKEDEIPVLVDYLVETFPVMKSSTGTSR
jgi:cytochrome c5